MTGDLWLIIVMLREIIIQRSIVQSQHTFKVVLLDVVRGLLGWASRDRGSVAIVS